MTVYMSWQNQTVQVQTKLVIRDAGFSQHRRQAGKLTRNGLFGKLAFQFRWNCPLTGNNPIFVNPKNRVAAQSEIASMDHLLGMDSSKREGKPVLQLPIGRAEPRIASIIVPGYNREQIESPRCQSRAVGL
jgi:hypothetical protein